MVAAEDTVVAEDIIKAAVAAVAAMVATTTTIPIKEATEDLLKAAEASTTIKGPRSSTIIKGTTIKVDTKPIKASIIIKDLLKAKVAEAVAVSTPEGETISTTLKWVLGPIRVPITK